MDKEKISLFTISLRPGGAERVVSIIANSLCEIYDVHLVLMHKDIFYPISDNVRVYFLEEGKSRGMEMHIYKFSKIPYLAYKYSKFLKQNGIDVSLSFLNRPNYINILTRTFHKSLKPIVSERTSPSKEYKALNLRNFVSKLLIKYLYRKAYKVVPNSKYVACELTEIFGISSKDIIVIHNPINCVKPCLDKGKNKRFTFITVGRLNKEKNHEFLIKAFKIANLDAELWIIGDGPLKNKLQKLVKGLKLEDKVFFLGIQKNIFDYLSKAHCFVLSSMHEGFPNVILEALSCGLPVISTDCHSGPREILAPDTDFRKQTKNELETAKFGILVPTDRVDIMANAMRLIFNNKDLQNKYKDSSLKRAKDFCVDKILYEYRKLIEQACSSG